MQRNSLTGQPANRSHPGGRRTALIIAYGLGALILFVFALDLMISSLQHLGSEAIQEIILATRNPFTALFIGLLVTAMLQSSSTTTSMVVALVASGSITLQNAIPIIMGANVGTTITSTIVAIGFISKRKEFRRAVAAGTFHDMFNIFTVIILFPLERYYGFLSSLSVGLAQYFQPALTMGAKTIIPNWSVFGSPVNFLVNRISSGFILTALSFVLLFTSILVFRRLISKLLMAQSPERFSRFFFRGHIKSFAWGLLTTAAIRSSTITTSVVVPIVAKKIVSLRKAAPFILGANIGTTITALLAAILNANTESAISIAVAHILFNLIGVLIFFPFPFLRAFPVRIAQQLGTLTIQHRLLGFVYILAVFFFIPFMLIYLNADSVHKWVATYRVERACQPPGSEVVVIALQANGQSGSWETYLNARDVPNRPADLIHAIHRTGDVFFINQEAFLFSKPGSCWDGQSDQGKYRMCTKEIIPHFTTAAELSFDSVYVFWRGFPESTTGKTEEIIYVSPHYPFLLREESRHGGELIEKREILRLARL